MKRELPRQIGWVISVEDWALIRRLVAEGVSQLQVARDLGVARKTVAGRWSWMSSRGMCGRWDRTRSRRSRTGSVTCSEYPLMPATVIAERVDWSGSITWFRDNVRWPRPEYAPVDPADRLVHEFGDQTQCDLWFPPVKIPVDDTVPATLPVLVMVPTGVEVRLREDPAVTADARPAGGHVVDHRRSDPGGAATAGLGQRGRHRPSWPPGRRSNGCGATR